MVIAGISLIKGRMRGILVGEREGFTDRLVLHYNKDLKEPSRRLRESMTDAESLLWTKIRLRQINGFQFSRQRPIGNYIVDFFCHKAKLVIEIDGSQHFSDGMIENDRVRDEFLRSLGLRVLRFTNVDVLTNIDGVVESIIESMRVTEEKIS